MPVCNLRNIGQRGIFGNRQHTSGRISQKAISVQGPSAQVKRGKKEPPPLNQKARDALQKQLDAEPDEQAPQQGTKQPGMPLELRYFDKASICLMPGDGGAGCTAFLRDKQVAEGGPNGGNGGHGGNIWAIADTHENSLRQFRKKVHFRAMDGKNGMGSSLHGRNGYDTEIAFPIGTIIRYKDRPEEPPIAEITKKNQRFVLAQGGMGGLGNKAFKCQENNAPVNSERGEKGETVWLDLELKVVADCGIIGVPNCGKSTLLSKVSNAKPKIAPYPFTTLVPNLGVCELDYMSTVFADVPGLIEGAYRGAGLGLEFLRHCERTRMLIHIVDGSSYDPVYDYKAINYELEMFNPALRAKPQIVAYNKMDMEDAEVLFQDVKQLLVEEGVREDLIFPISAVNGVGLEPLVRKVREVLKRIPRTLEPDPTARNKTAVDPKLAATEDVGIFEYEVDVQQGRDQDDFTKQYFTVRCPAIERLASMTNWNMLEALMRFDAVIETSGLKADLVQKKIQEGDLVSFGESTCIEWYDTPGMIKEHIEGIMKSRGKTVVGSSKFPHGGVVI